ncbi:hypothetical protein GF325_15220 [Candidatus Bathyarchaeota archaeon]|nr:hypothetical protein [Candidatus Bathyarchaeota archaeon]
MPKKVPGTENIGKKVNVTRWNPLEEKPNGSLGYFYYFVGMIYLAFETYKEFKAYVKNGGVKVNRKLRNWEKDDAFRKFDALFENENRITFLKHNVKDFIQAIANKNMDSFSNNPGRFTDPNNPSVRLLYMLVLFAQHEQQLPDNITDKKGMLAIIKKGIMEHGLDKYVENVISSIEYWQLERK